MPRISHYGYIRNIIALNLHNLEYNIFNYNKGKLENQISLKQKMDSKKNNMMRRIDYWVGVPLCFLLTLIDRISGLFPFKRRGGDVPKKILFIKPSEMGGIILSYPLIRRVQEEYPDAEMFFLTFKPNECLFEVLGAIPARNILTIRDESPFTFIGDVVKALLRMRSEKMDVVFDLEFFSRFTAIIAYLTGAAKRIGFYRYTF